MDTTENGTENGLDLTKSTILAPFNTPEPEEKKFIIKIQKQLINKKIIKFSSKLREFDRRYERENNSQLDNGVYVQVVNDTQSPKTGSSTTKSKVLPQAALTNSKSSTMAVTRTLTTAHHGIGMS